MGLNPQPVGERPAPPKAFAPLGIKERVAKIQTLSREYDNAMLNEDLDSYDDLLYAVKDVLIELGYPPSLQALKNKLQYPHGKNLWIDSGWRIFWRWAVA